MKNTWLLQIALIISGFCFSQPQYSELIIEDPVPGLYPQGVSLFDRQEIKERKIKTAYIIRHNGGWAEYDSTFNPCSCHYSDTSFIYTFKEDGDIAEYTYFNSRDQYSTTYYGKDGKISARKDVNPGSKIRLLRFDEKPDSAYYKQIISHYRIANDRIIKRIIFLEFKHSFDTAYTITERYNSKGKLVEKQSESNKKNNHLFFDNHNGDYDYHYQYDYDAQGRINYFRDFKSDDYNKFSYPSFGKLTEVFDVKTDRLKYSHARIIQQINREATVTKISSENQEMILTWLAKGSKLLKLKVIINPSEITTVEYQEFIYE